MLDIKRILENPKEIEEKLNTRFDAKKYDFKEIIELNEKRKEIVSEVETKKALRNKTSKEIPILKKEGKDVEEIFEKMRLLGEEIKELDEKQKQVDDKLQDILLRLPNIPAKSVAIGKDDSENVEVRRVGTPREFNFEPKSHWDLGENLDILDFERASKISGARFSIFKNKGARLERALINFMLDVHTLYQDYTEIAPPQLVKSTTMQGTGQLPKFAEDAYKIDGEEEYLVPTAEVPVTNYYSNEVIDFDKDITAFTAYTACFRKEAGSAGRDTRGLIRNHQFDKVEMVRFAKPNESYNQLEKLTNDGEEILKRLNLPYRVVRLCSGDLGFSAAETYDIEVWMPSYGRYVEISSCSNCEDFQARRANIKFRNEDGKLSLVHTLNGSGLAVGRTLAAIVENYQNEDGTIDIPEELKKYLPFEKIEK
ncbi:MAG: serine--tRNA ligase [Peptoniphilaceae bacterium]|nr:serine--tRNA ligase [Peptoniphilaceae bacterium]MDD7382781.1 serine--tRNA ligase [Peptoniphilaceae bacterium]MDY3737937.1 serine--tRNA ligase [Peptoniphilaceae bacterium]